MNVIHNVAIYITKDVITPTPYPLPQKNSGDIAMTSTSQLYNKRQKGAFLDELGDDAKRSVYSSLFHKLYRLEVEQGDDLSAISKDDILNFLIALSLPDGTLRSYISRIKTYIQWCVSNNIPFVNKELLRLSLCDAPENDNTQRLMVGSPTDLAARLDELFSPVEDCATDLPVRVCFWLAFMGVDKEAALRLHCDTVDIENKLVTVGDLTYNIPNEAIPAFAMCARAKCFYAMLDPAKSGKKPHKIHRCRGDLFLRNSTNVHNASNFKSYLNNVNSYREKITGLRNVMRYNNILKSGLFFDIYAASEDHGDWIDSPSALRAFQEDARKQEEAYIAKNPRYAPTKRESLNMRFYRDSKLRAEFFLWRKTFYGI